MQVAAVAAYNAVDVQFSWFESFCRVVERMDKSSILWVVLGVVLALGAGCVMAIQPAVNGRLASQCSHPLQASLISFATGFMALLSISILLGTGLPDFSKLSTLPYWAWTGGLLGTYMVTVSLLIAPKLGAVRWIALVLAGVRC